MLRIIRLRESSKVSSLSRSLASAPGCSSWFRALARSSGFSNSTLDSSAASALATAIAAARLTAACAASASGWAAELDSCAPATSTTTSRESATMALNARRGARNRETVLSEHFDSICTSWARLIGRRALEESLGKSIEAADCGPHGSFDRRRKIVCSAPSRPTKCAAPIAGQTPSLALVRGQKEILEGERRQRGAAGEIGLAVYRLRLLANGPFAGGACSCDFLVA